MDESQPLFHEASDASCALQVTLSSRQAARSTWVPVPRDQVVVPVLAKKTWKFCVWPGEMFTNADSPA